MIDNLFESTIKEGRSAQITASENRVIHECAKTLSTLSDSDLSRVLAEADLSPSDAAKVFKAASSVRDEPGLTAKAKDAYVNSAEKISKISTQVKSKLSSLISASEPATSKLINLIKQGGKTANQTIDQIDSKVEAQALQTKDAAKGMPNSYNRITKEIDNIEKIAKGSPQYGAFAVASLSSAANMMKRNASVSSIILYLATVSDVLKGKKLSSALQSSIDEIGASGTASVQEDDLNEDDEMHRIRELAGINSTLKEESTVTYDELLSTWNKKGRPTDIDEINLILSNAGLSKREISKAFRSAGIDTGEGSDFKVTRFATALKNIGLGSQVSEYLKDMFSKEITESVNLSEAEISDAQIKKVLLRVAKAQPPETESNEKAVKQYLKKWNKEFLQSATTDEQQQLAGEVVNYLHDRQEYPEYQDAVSTVTKIIRNSDLPDKTKRDVLSDIENRRVYKPRQKAETQKEKPRVKVTPNSSEKPRVRPKSTVESLTLDDLQQLFEDAILRNMEHQYGRRKR